VNVAYANFLTPYVTSVIDVRLTCVKMSDNSDDDLCAVAAAACTIVTAVESSRVQDQSGREDAHGCDPCYTPTN